ncbi:hypothetical protein PENSPDRAFT_650097 [Peniophora sp. CONT]|nr:hypothetical protein PENSPDRAFT_650097 [Peniophora sp. CONT]
MSTVTPTHDDHYYFHSVIFQTEDKLFKVPRYGLPGDSAVFDSMFAKATGGAGSSDENPILLDADVTAADFRSLLKATDPAAPVLTVEEWMGVLTLSKKWDIGSMKDKAVAGSDEMIQKKTVVDKILLAKKFGVAKWLREGYCALVSRETLITDQERQQLGWETYGRLMNAREKCLLASHASGLSTAQKHKCNACSEDHVPYCAENYNCDVGSEGRKWARRCSVCACSHIPGCWAANSVIFPPWAASASGQLWPRWAAFDSDDAVVEEFGLSANT